MRWLKTKAYQLLHHVLIRMGHSDFSASSTIKAVAKENKVFRDIPIVKRISYYKKGYLTPTIIRKNELKGKGYFLPEIEYYKLHPINGAYSHWIDDKLTLYYILAPFKQYLPELYLQVEKDGIHFLPDFNQEARSPEAILEFIKKKECLAFKPLNSSGGVGFKKIEYVEGIFRKNHQMISEKELLEQLFSSESYVLSEFIFPQEDIARINPFSTSTIRLIVLHDDDDVVRIGGAYIRFGTKEGITDNLSGGGFMAAVDTESGKIIGPGIYGKYRGFEKVYVHPDTKEVIGGQIKDWHNILKVIHDIAHYLPQIKYVGYDIAVTNESFKIIEANSLQEVINFDTYFDLPENDAMKVFFEKRIRKD